MVQASDESYTSGTKPSPLKQRVLDALVYAQQNTPSGWISGESLASLNNVSRTAIWKAVQQLESEGLSIEGMRHKGYRLIEPVDILNQREIQRLLYESPSSYAANIVVKEKTESTNDDAKNEAEVGCQEGLCVIAGEQTKGRGRRGRSFFSLGQSGVYLSIVLRPQMTLSESSKITACAAVAVARAIERVFPHLTPQIKWVNDVYVKGRKVCGILTEGATDLETGMLSYAVCGIGINVYKPKNGFPEEYNKRAGYLSETITPNTRNTLAAYVVDEFMKVYHTTYFDSFIDEYKNRSFLTDMEIEIIAGPHSGESAVVQGITNDLGLRVVTDNENEIVLQSGEVSIRIE